MEALILDASVLIGLLDASDSHHDRAVDEVDQADRTHHQLLTPATAYGEALVAFGRAGRVNDARDAIAGMGIAVVPLTAPIAERAAELRARHESLRLPDALVLATAHEQPGTLLTYDERLARTTRQRRERRGPVRATAAWATNQKPAGSHTDPVLTLGFTCSTVSSPERRVRRVRLAGVGAV